MVRFDVIYICQATSFNSVVICASKYCKHLGLYILSKLELRARHDITSHMVVSFQRAVSSQFTCHYLTSPSPTHHPHNPNATYPPSPPSKLPNNVYSFLVRLFHIPSIDQSPLSNYPSATPSNVPVHASEKTIGFPACHTWHGVLGNILFARNTMHMHICPRTSINK